MLKKIFSIIFLGAFLGACGIGNTNTTYDRAQIGRQASTSTGRIVAMTQIEIAGTDTGLGTAAGAIVGGAAGAAIAMPNDHHHHHHYSPSDRAVGVLGAAGGAVVGGIAGNLAEKAITKDTAFEFIIEKPNGSVISIVQTNELGLREGDKVLLIDTDGTTRIRRKL